MDLHGVITSSAVLFTLTFNIPILTLLVSLDLVVNPEEDSPEKLVTAHQPFF